MQIDIHLPSPGRLLAYGVLAAVVVNIWGNGGQQDPSAVGGQTPAAVVEAEAQMRDDRVELEVLSRREEILRYQLDMLEQEAATGNLAYDADVRAARDELRHLLLNRRDAEAALLSSLREMWEARGYAVTASRREPGERALTSLEWPVEPVLGISAHFEDAGYRKRFGFDHHAIDIPVGQGSPVATAADGIVEKVTDNGMGFNSLTIRHAGGVATLYGHVSKFLVSEGQRVRAGDIVALSGGTPGTKGAGLMTTGAHLHFEVFVDGRKTDPLPYMPAYPGVE